jgi:shikimate 5-dehydrogenase
MNLVDVVNGKTELYGLLGNPVEHTKSPFIHNTLFKALKINAIYVPVRVNSDELEKAVNGFRAQNFSGFNITVPYKKDIIQYLDDVSKDALLLGAVNTVKNNNGRFIGYNTDAEGFVKDFCDGFETNFSGKRVLLLGAGGTARAIAVRLASEGIDHLTIANRTEANARNIENLIINNFGNIVSTITPEPDLLNDAVENSQIIINTTPAGMSTYLDSTPFDFNFIFNGSQMVYDVIYVPKKTKLLKQAEEAGCKIRSGFGMLINQGISAFEIWTGMHVGNELTNELLKKIENLEEF